ncbi:hypothetical protein FC85_GL002952 [Lentilactobacillus diolivorans DSM 14421]|uniref:Uncharacterized protein n=1 Tax=Lentilactobacillus diolivorans DSM 14421 TaxID=1423739 RepID=A0A0R1SHC4_9LACO|nr:hypothetical protein FC85_GL002952 [Lentilactobacillus diolivorans DSM 14421]
MAEPQTVKSSANNNIITDDSHRIFFDVRMLCYRFSILGLAVFVDGLHIIGILVGRCLFFVGDMF